MHDRLYIKYIFMIKTIVLHHFPSINKIQIKTIRLQSVALHYLKKFKSTFCTQHAIVLL